MLKRKRALVLDGDGDCLRKKNDWQRWGTSQARLAVDGNGAPIKKKLMAAWERIASKKLTVWLLAI